MINLNLKKVLIIVKENKKLIGLILIGIMVIVFGILINNNIKTQKELEKVKNQLEENKEVIFYNTQSVETKQKKNTISIEIESLRKELDKLNNYDKCIENQLDRLANNQVVDLEYCENFTNEIEPIIEVPKIETPEKISIENVVDRDDEVIKWAMELIKKYEGIRYTAYWDTRQYSICFGTKSYKGAKATHEECESMLKERVQNELLRINRLADNLEVNKKIALISLFYNIWYKDNILYFAKNGDHKSVTYLISLYNSAGGIYLPWLQKRRNEEVKIYNS